MANLQEPPGESHRIPWGETRHDLNNCQSSIPTGALWGGSQWGCRDVKMRNRWGSGPRPYSVWSARDRPQPVAENSVEWSRDVRHRFCLWQVHASSTMVKSLTWCRRGGFGSLDRCWMFYEVTIAVWYFFTHEELDLLAELSHSWKNARLSSRYCM